MKVKKGRKTVVKRKTITVGTASYDLAVGAGGSLRVGLSSASRKALKMSGLTASADGLSGAIKLPKSKAKHKKR